MWRTMADETICQDPREYFLTVMRYRLKQISNEWTEVVNKLSTNIREHEQVVLSNSTRQYSSRSRKVVTKLQVLSKMLLLNISNTVDSCGEFCRHPALDFQSDADPTDPRP